jgi:predicted site-specific integrase-resolvase
MPVTLNGQTYYRTAEVCRTVGICRNTLFRWLKAGIFREAQYRDRRGWRLFTEDEIDILKAEANRISKTEQFKTKRGPQLSRHFS